MTICSLMTNIISEKEILTLCHLQEFKVYIYDHLLINQQIIVMLTHLMATSFANFSRAAKPKTLKQRLKYYAKYPDQFKLKTRIRPPDLTDPNLKFPIKIPIRYRHQFHLKKQLVVENSSKIHWNRLQPNQILLALESIQHMSFKQLVDGLRYLSEIKGQQTHDWNKHQWVSVALNKVKLNLNQIKKKDIMNFYFLMKKLKYTDEQFWKKMYAKIEENIYDLYPNQFSYIYLTYYDKLDTIFSPQAKVNFDKLMEGRIREFTPAVIIQIFQKFIRDKKLDNYWLENVFISLFKHNQYAFNAQQIATIFRSMMILNHQNNDRLYSNLYKRIENLNYQNISQIELLEEVLMEVKQIFTSHRVDPSLDLLAQKKKQLSEVKTEQKKKTIQQMVKDDLKYFIEKRKLKTQEKGTQTISQVPQ